MTDLNWQRQASCASAPLSSLPWTEEPGVASPSDGAVMARVCAGCPVRLACAAYARRVDAGFWAGRERGTLENAGPVASVPVQDVLPGFERDSVQSGGVAA